MRLANRRIDVQWRRVSPISAAVAAVFAASTASGDQRLFTYVYEATTMPKGAVEYEQWATWLTDKPDDSSFDRLDFRHELEWGLTDHLQLGLYLADWRYENGRSVDDDGVEYRDSALEVIYNLTSPVTDGVGMALYGEYKVGPDLQELEGKLIVQKNLGAVVLAYNAILEAQWEQEGGRWEDNGQVAQTAGASYMLSPQFSLGAELLHEVPLPDWSESDPSVLYAGPNFSWRLGRWWVTITQFFQVTDEAGEPDFQTRLITGVNF